MWQKPTNLPGIAIVLPWQDKTNYFNSGKCSSKNKKGLLKKQTIKAPTKWIIKSFSYWKCEELNDLYLQNIMSLQTVQKFATGIALEFAFHSAWNRIDLLCISKNNPFFPRAFTILHLVPHSSIGSPLSCADGHVPTWQIPKSISLAKGQLIGKTRFL